MAMKPYEINSLLQNTEITYMCEVKFLGMCITENLSWQAYIHVLCRSLSRTYYIIKPVGYCRVVSTEQLQYNTYIDLFKSKQYRETGASVAVNVY
jgi:hypothetical protein